MQLTAKIKIEPTEEQKEVLWVLSEKCRLIYNFALEERRKCYKNDLKISYVKQQNDLPELKKKYPEYKWVYSKVLQGVLRKLDADYKSYRQLKKLGFEDANPPRFKGRKYFTTMTYNQSGFKLLRNQIKLSHNYNDTKLVFDIPSTLNIGATHVYEIAIFMKDEKYYISVVYEEHETDYNDNEKYQAIDPGSFKHQGVNSEGKFTKFVLPRPDKHWSKIYKSVQSRRDHCIKYSNKWNYYNNKYKKLRRKSSNALKDAQHKLSNKIVNNTKANTIIIGDIGVKKLCGKKKDKSKKSLHESMHNTGNISRLVGFLTYKSQRAGKRLIEIDESYTTKQCCCCGKLHDMPLWKRMMKCDCGNEMDRDENSSVNIMLRYLSQNGLWTTYQHFVDNLRQTGILLRLHSQEAPTSAAKPTGGG